MTKESEVTRRAFVSGAAATGALGVTACVTGTQTGHGHQDSRKRPSSLEHRGGHVSEHHEESELVSQEQIKLVETLVAPIKPGYKLPHSKVIELALRPEGIATILLMSEGVQYTVEICKFSEAPAEPAGVAQTNEYALFVHNDGLGYQETNENIAQDLQVVAKLISENESSVKNLVLKTKRSHQLYQRKKRH